MRTASLASRTVILLVRTTQLWFKPPNTRSETETSGGHLPLGALVIITTHRTAKSPRTAGMAATSPGRLRVTAAVGEEARRSACERLQRCERNKLAFHHAGHAERQLFQNFVRLGATGGVDDEHDAQAAGLKSPLIDMTGEMISHGGAHFEKRDFRDRFGRSFCRHRTDREDLVRRSVDGGERGRGFSIQTFGGPYPNYIPARLTAARGFFPPEPR
jgi:hypothetical protein